MDDTTTIVSRHAQRARPLPARRTRSRAGACTVARIATVAAILAALSTGHAALAQSHAGHGAHDRPSAAAADTAPAAPAAPAANAGESATDGEIRRVDVAGGRLTLRHGPIPSLDMPAMTMVFRVVAPASIDGLAPGDRVRFRATTVDGDPAVIWIEKAR